LPVGIAFQPEAYFPGSALYKLVAALRTGLKDAHLKTTH
jgi:hypothetical protein